MGWSDTEFWKSSSRKLYAFLYTYTDLQVESSKNAMKKQALVGKDAINALTQLASRIH